MKRMKRFLGLFLISGILFTNSVPVHARELLPSGVENVEIGEQIEAFVEAHKETTAGMSVSVFNEENNVYTGYFGYGDKENAVIMDAETVVEWGSATKLLVWVSVMQLWEQGKLDLDADVKELYQKNGIGHILAISGLHISFIGLGIYKLIRKSGLGYLLAVMISIGILQPPWGLSPLTGKQKISTSSRMRSTALPWIKERLLSSSSTRLTILKMLF